MSSRSEPKQVEQHCSARTLTHSQSTAAAHISSASKTLLFMHIYLMKILLALPHWKCRFSLSLHSIKYQCLRIKFIKTIHEKWINAGEGKSLLAPQKSHHHIAWTKIKWKWKLSSRRKEQRRVVDSRRRRRWRGGINKRRKITILKEKMTTEGR